MNPGYGYTLATEKDGEEYFCPGSNDWHPSSEFRCHHKDCGKVWRKKVVVPDGWELVPEDGVIAGTSFSYDGHDWTRLGEDYYRGQRTVREVIADPMAFPNVVAFIRRKSEPVKAEDGESAWAEWSKQLKPFNIERLERDRSNFLAGFKAGKESR